MEFISAEEFLKQDKEVQKVFIDWMNKNLDDNDLIYMSGHIMLYKDYKNRPDDKISCFSIMLLTEGRIRQFIEDKTNCEFEVNFEETFNDEYSRCITIYDNNTNLCKRTFQNLKVDLLQAYWKVAVEIARKEVCNNGR